MHHSVSINPQGQMCDFLLLSCPVKLKSDNRWGDVIMGGRRGMAGNKLPSMLSAFICYPGRDGCTHHEGQLKWIQF